MTVLAEQIKRINDKLQQLLKQHQLLQKENEKLKKELRQYMEKDQNKTIQLEELQQQTEILKYSHHPGMDGAEKKAFEKRLNQYIKEIDRCIALLNE